MLRDHLGPDLEAFTYLIAGPPKMVEAMEEVVSGEGVPRSRSAPS